MNGVGERLLGFGPDRDGQMQVVVTPACVRVWLQLLSGWTLAPLVASTHSFLHRQTVKVLASLWHNIPVRDAVKKAALAIEGRATAFWRLLTFNRITGSFTHQPDPPADIAAQVSDHF